MHVDTHLSVRASIHPGAPPTHPPVHPPGTHDAHTHTYMHVSERPSARHSLEVHAPNPFYTSVTPPGDLTFNSPRPFPRGLHVEAHTGTLRCQRRGPRGLHSPSARQGKEAPPAPTPGGLWGQAAAGRWGSHRRRRQRFLCPLRQSRDQSTADSGARSLVLVSFTWRRFSFLLAADPSKLCPQTRSRPRAVRGLQGDASTEAPGCPLALRP